MKKKSDWGVYECDGTWYARWREKGKIIRKACGNKAAAQEYYATQKNRVREEKLFPEKAVAKKIKGQTVAKLIEHYREEWSRKRSVQDDERYAKYWIVHCGDTFASALTPGDIEKWRSRRIVEDKVAPGTVNKAVSFLRRIYNMAIRDGLVLVRNPASSTVCPFLAEENEQFRVLSYKEEETLRGHATIEEWEKIELAFLTGLRSGEQFRLRARDVDIGRGGGILWVRTGAGAKSKKARRVPLSDRAAQILEGLMADGRDYLYPGRFNGTRFQPNSAYRMLQRIATDAKLPDITWHALRHTFGTRYMENGGQIDDLQVVMGHSSITVTRRYLTSNLDRARDVVNRMGGSVRPTLRVVKAAPKGESFSNSAAI